MTIAIIDSSHRVLYICRIAGPKFAIDLAAGRASADVPRPGVACGRPIPRAEILRWAQNDRRALRMTANDRISPQA